LGRRPILYLMAAGTVLLWGASFPLTRLALMWSGPTSVAFLRWSISALALGTWLTISRHQRQAKGPERSNPDSAPPDKLLVAGRLLRREARTLLWVSLCGITVFYFLENLAMRYTSVINAGVLANLTTVFIVLLGTVWLHERLTGLEWLAMAIAFLGAVIVSQGSGHLTISAPGLRGDLLMVVASFFGAVYSIGGKRLVDTSPPDVVMALVATVGAAFLLPLALLEGLNLALPPAAWGVLLLLGLGAGALANLWWLSILAQTRASRAGLVPLLVPVTSTTLAVLALGEPLTVTVVLGGTLVVGGVAATELVAARRSGPER